MKKTFVGSFVLIASLLSAAPAFAIDWPANLTGALSSLHVMPTGSANEAHIEAYQTLLRRRILTAATATAAREIETVGQASLMGQVPDSSPASVAFIQLIAKTKNPNSFAAFKILADQNLLNLKTASEAANIVTESQVELLTALRDSQYGAVQFLDLVARASTPGVSVGITSLVKSRTLTRASALRYFVAPPPEPTSDVTSYQWVLLHTMTDQIGIDEREAHQLLNWPQDYQEAELLRNLGTQGVLSSQLVAAFTANQVSRAQINPLPQAAPIQACLTAFADAQDFVPWLRRNGGFPPP